MHDPITYKVFSPHIHIVFLKNTVSYSEPFQSTGNVRQLTSGSRETYSTCRPSRCSRSSPRHGAT